LSTVIGKNAKVKFWVDYIYSTQQHSSKYLRVTPYTAIHDSRTSVDMSEMRFKIE